MRNQVCALRRADAIEYDPERPLRGNGRIELFERASRGISRIRENEQPFFGARGVQFDEAILVHEDLAANLQNRGCSPSQLCRYGADRADVLRDVIANRAVATGRGVT